MPPIVARVGDRTMTIKVSDIKVFARERKNENGETELYYEVQKQPDGSITEFDDAHEAARHVVENELCLISAIDWTTSEIENMTEDGDEVECAYMVGEELE